MSHYSTVTCMGYSVFTDSLERLFDQKKAEVSTINQYSYCIAEKDLDFKQSLMQADVLLPDGIGIVIASRVLNGNRIRKIAGADLHEFLLKKLEAEEGSCFYLGSSQNTLEKIESRIYREYPNIRVGTHSPPYKTAFKEEDSEGMRRAVNDFRPDVLFVGMTAPKQEKWSHSQKDLLNARIICSIGAVFDFYAGTVERPNKIWIDLGLEWLGRLLKEPRRMWKRYIYYGGVFAYYLCKEKISPSNPKKDQLTS